MGQHALAAIDSVERDRLLHPEIGFFGRLDDGVQRHPIVGVLPPIHGEYLIGDWLPRSRVKPERPDRCGQGGRQRCDVFHQAEAVTGRSLERSPRIVVGKHVPRLVPRASEKESAIVRLVPAPFLHVAGHVERAEGAKSVVAPDWRRTGFIEITDRQDVSEAPEVGCTVPVIDGRQALTGGRRVCRRLVPTYAAHGRVGLTGGIGARLPRRGSRPAGRVAKSRDRFLPRHGSAGFDEWLAPVVASPVAALIDERFVLRVRDLEPIHPEVVDLADEAKANGIAAADDAHHAGRHLVHLI